MPGSPWMNMQDLMKLWGQNYSPAPDEKLASMPGDMPTQQDLNQAYQAPVPIPYQGSGAMGAGASMHGTGLNTKMIDELYKELNTTGAANLVNQKANMDQVQKLIATLPTQRQDTNLAPLGALADAWAGPGNKSNFAGTYHQPAGTEELTAQKIAQLLSANKGQQGITQDELAILRDKLGLATAKNNFGMANQMKADDQDEKDAQNLVKQLDVEKASGRFSPVGKAQMNLNQAQRIEALINQFPDLNSMPPQQVAELAGAADSLVTNGTSTVSGREHLIPKSLQGDQARIANYFQNQAGGAGQADFIQKLMDLVQREKSVAGSQIGNYLNKVTQAAGSSRFAKRQPDRFKGIVDLYMNSPTLGGGGPPIGSIQDGHRFKGGNPADPQSWEQVK